MISSDSCHCAALWRGHLLVLWYGETSLEAALMVARSLLNAARARPKHTAYIAVLSDSLRLPSAEVREVWVQLRKQIGGDLNSITVIVEGRGFSAAGVRGMVTGIGMASRAPYPMRAFPTIEEAASWAKLRVESAGGSLGAPFELAEALDTLKKSSRL